MRESLTLKDYSTIASSWTKIPTGVQEVFVNICIISKLLFIPLFLTEPWLGNTDIGCKEHLLRFPVHYLVKVV
jgi:hypothetical protein